VLEDFTLTFALEEGSVTGYQGGQGAG